MAKKNKQPKPVKVSETKILELAGKQFKSPEENRKLGRMVQGLMDSLTEKQKGVAAMQR
jgi:hypothetical protein